MDCTAFFILLMPASLPYTVFVTERADPCGPTNYLTQVDERHYATEVVFAV